MIVNKIMRVKFYIFSVLFSLLNMMTLEDVAAEDAGNLISPKREMRAVWIATVANLDWPSKKGLSVEAQKDELIRMLDVFKSCNINTVIFQARPSSDTFYKSNIEPWSVWLTGKEGKEPEPFYDPLQFIIEEAHKRCMEVHVWINPYRALSYNDISRFAKNHIYWKHKDWFIKYGGKYYFDPGKNAVQKYLLSVVCDIVSRYDIDAIHLDDYFYPYPLPKEHFADDETFKNNPNGFKKRSEWRRDNVTRTIVLLRDSIKSLKPWVQFGISPFGVWRHFKDDKRGSKTWKALSNYDDLNADVYKWMKDSLIDYVVPQLYWEIGKKNTDYRVLVDWWSNNCFQTNLYTGLYVSGLIKPLNDTPAWKKPNELIRQLKYNKGFKNVEGAMFFSANSFVLNKQGLIDSLKSVYYTYPAIVPFSKLNGGKPSEQPSGIKVKKCDDKILLSWKKVDDDNKGMEVSYYVVYMFKGKRVGNIDDASNIIIVTPETNLDVTSFCLGKHGKYCFVVTSINRFRQESKINKTAVVKL